MKFQGLDNDGQKSPGNCMRIYEQEAILNCLESLVLHCEKPTRKESFYG